LYLPSLKSKASLKKMPRTMYLDRGKTNAKLQCQFIVVWGRGISNMSDQSVVGAARTSGLRQYHPQPPVGSSSSRRAKREEAPHQCGWRESA
jgi:hypothetical protein